MRRILTVLACLFWATPAWAHRLDEYLQASRISLDPAGLIVEIDLTPGSAVADRVIGRLDTNGDGELSVTERDGYAALVVGDAALEIDGRRSWLALVDSQFPPISAMRDGVGVIQLRARGPRLPSAGRHAVRFFNLHEPEISAFLVNALMPPPGITITGQRRDYWQHEITIDYAGDRTTNPAWMIGGVLALLGVVALTIYRFTPASAPAVSAPETSR